MMLLAALMLITEGKTFYTSGVSGAQVATSCQVTTENTSVNLCTSYTLGVFDALSQEGLICSNRNTTIEQIVAIGKKAFADHPEDWNRLPSWVIGRSLKDAFPCLGGTKR